MIPQYVAAALVSENKVLAIPARVDSIPTSAGQEDHVSMGNARGPQGAAGARERRARRSRSSCSRARRRSSSSRRSSPASASARRTTFVRTLSDRLREDRSLSADIERVAAAIRDGSLLSAVESTVGGARVSDLPPPPHAYRGAATLHAVLAVVILVIAGDLRGQHRQGVRRGDRVLRRRDGVELVPLPSARVAGRRATVERETGAVMRP